MRYLNRVTLIGNVSTVTNFEADRPSPVFNFILATSEKYSTKAGKQERVEFHKIAAFGKTATLCNEIIVKGSLVYVDGRLQYSKYLKDNVEHVASTIFADNVIFLKTPKKEPDVEQDIDYNFNV